MDQAAPREESPKGGRPAYPTETMVRILVLKRLNNHSDERMDFLFLDRLSYQRFCGLTDALKVPDRTTIWNFENRIDEAGAMALFEGVSEQLLKKGFIARGDQMIDATLVPAPKQKISRKEKEIIDQRASPSDWAHAQCRQKDADVTWAKKHKFIRKIVTDTASAGDSSHFENAFDPANTSRDVCADRGYLSKAREAWLKSKGYRSQIQRKGQKNNPLSECQQRRNHRISKSRARMEHVFAGIEQMGGKMVRTIGQTRANFARTKMAACYN